MMMVMITTIFRDGDVDDDDDEYDDARENHEDMHLARLREGRE